MAGKATKPRDGAVLVAPFALKFSINLTGGVGMRLKEVAFQQRLSESSIIEVALEHLFARVDPEVLGAFLRQNGACLRRKT